MFEVLSTSLLASEVSGAGPLEGAARGLPGALRVEPAAHPAGDPGAAGPVAAEPRARARVLARAVFQHRL